MVGDYTTSYPRPVDDKPTIANRFQHLTGIYNARNKEYGDNYKTFGRVALALFPDGVHINDPNDWNRLALLLHVADKLTRYSKNFNKGGHADSLDDMCVYAQMLREIDDER